MSKTLSGSRPCTTRADVKNGPETTKPMDLQAQVCHAPSIHCDMFTNSAAVAQTVSRDLHRSRRTPLQPFFSKQAVLSLEASIQSKVDLMCKGIKERFISSQRILPIGTAFTALTLDVITEYCFGESWNCLNELDFAQNWKDAMTNLFGPVPLVKQFPWVLQILNCIPSRFILKLGPDMARMPMAKEVLSSVRQRGCLLTSSRQPSKT